MENGGDQQEVSENEKILLDDYELAPNNFCRSIPDPPLGEVPLCPYSLQVARRTYRAIGLSGYRALLVEIVIVSLLIGCGRPRGVETSAILVSSNSKRESQEPIDLGVVLRGTPTRICLPLSAFSFPDHRKLVAVETSCECVTTQLLTYRTPGGETDHAVLIEVIHDDPTYRVGEDDSTTELERPAKLIVNLTFRSESDTAWERQLRFLCSNQEAVPQ